jgi:hypothetical protein
MKPHEHYLRELISTLPESVDAEGLINDLCNTVDRLASDFDAPLSADLAKVALVMRLWDQIANFIHPIFPMAAIENSVLPSENNRRLVIFFYPEATCGFGIAWNGPQFNEFYWGIFRSVDFH